MSCHIWLGIFVVSNFSYSEIVDVLFIVKGLNPGVTSKVS